MTESYLEFSWNNKEWFRYWKKTIRELEELGFKINVIWKPDRPLIRINDFAKHLGEITIRSEADLNKLTTLLSIKEIKKPFQGSASETSEK